MSLFTILRGILLLRGCFVELEGVLLLKLRGCFVELERMLLLKWWFIEMLC